MLALLRFRNNRRSSIDQDENRPRSETTCTLQTPEKSVKENRLSQHQRSPTGNTPTAKRQKGNESLRLDTGTNIFNSDLKGE